MSSSPIPQTPVALPTDTLLPPKALGANRDSIATSVSADPSFKQGSPAYGNVPLDDFSGEEKPKRKSRKLVWAVVAVVGLAVVVVAVVVPVYFKVIKPNNNNSVAQQPESGASSTVDAPQPTPTETTPNVITTGRISGVDGSIITKEDGTTFTYSNKFGGFWVFDPKNPYNNSARPQSWSPPLNEPWNYGTEQIRGVNLGGWLVLEPFIVPAMYEPYQPDTPGYTGIHAVDEYTLHQAITADTSRGGLQAVMEEHYSTFITEEDFAMIAGAGMNWIRLPIPFWAVSKLPEEPYLEGVAWKYFLKAIEWARKYGLRINLDLHTIPGSQNGFDHSGKLGRANWMHGVMGVANAQRALNIMRSITEFISRDEIKDVVVMFGVLNEPPMATITLDPITSYYREMYDMMRNVTGVGNGPFISIHDGFSLADVDDGLLPGADRLAVDSHLYLCFAPRLNPAPLAEQVNVPCTSWGAQFNRTLDNGVFITSGEWSLGFNDCAWYLNGAGAGYRYDGTLPSYGGPRIGSCDPWLDSREWTDETKANLKQFTLASMDAMQHYFFWTWRIGESSRTGQVNAPLWSYKLGYLNGWMPTDPREAIGTCGNTNPRTATPNYTPTPPTTISDAVRAAHPFPPPSLADQPNAAILPTYTPTGTPRVMPGPTFTAATVAVPTPTLNMNGWQGDYVPVEGCTYPDLWNAVGIAVPAQC